MKKSFIKLIKKIVNPTLLHLVLPKHFGPNIYNKFIKVFDEIANKNIFLFLRKDSFMEAVIMEKGLYGDWEKESLKLWVALVSKSSTIIDIGANTGIFSLIAQNNNPNAKVIAVEPININFEVLTKNIQKNNFPISAEKVALSSVEGEATMYMLKDRLNYMTSVNDDRYKLHPEIQGNTEVVPIQVPIKPFKYIVEKYNLTDVNLIKLDVEGHELAVLQSMEETLLAYHPSILIEVIGDDNANELDIFFRKMGYETYLSVDENKGVRIVEKIWDNDHANFLICQKHVIDFIPTNMFY